MEYEKKTFYPDLSKNHEFIERLKNILNRENSSIGLCYISLSLSNRFTVFIEPYSKKGYGISFCFHDSELSAIERSKARYIQQGFNEEDICLLYDLFTDFSLSNSYESNFFGSLFFIDEFTLNNGNYQYVLKYTEDEAENRFIIDGLNVTKHYAVKSLENIKEQIVNAPHNYKTKSLIPCRFYSTDDVFSLKNAVDKMKALRNKEGMVIGEYCKEFDTGETFLKELYALNGEKLIVLAFDL